MKVQIALYLAGSLLNYALVEGWLTGAIDRALWRHSRRYRRLVIRRSLVGWRLDYHDRGSRIHIIGGRKKSKTRQKMKLNLVPQALPGLTETEREGIVALARMVLAGLPSFNSQRMYGIRLKQFFRTGLPLTREGVSTWLNSHRDWSAATSGQAISIIRKLVREAELRELIDPREARGILAIPCRPNRGIRHGNWLTIDDVRKLIAAPGPTWEGKRDRAVLALLTGCGLRRTEAVNLNWSQYQARDGRMCLVDVVGKGQKLRTIPVPQWVEEIIETWREVAPNQREAWKPGMEPKTIDPARKARIWEARETLERRMTEVYLELVPQAGPESRKNEPGEAAPVPGTETLSAADGGYRTRLRRGSRHRRGRRA